mgnify:FL=1
MNDTDLVSDVRIGAQEGDYQLERASVSAVLGAVDRGDQGLLTMLMDPLHPADIADLLEQISAPERRDLIRLYDREFDGEILSELDESIRDEVMTILRPEVLADAVRELESDDVVDLIEDLTLVQQDIILDALDDSDRVAVEQSLTYPEKSAGRLMQREVVMAPEHWTVGQAIDYLRAQETLPEQFYHVTLVDPRFKPVGNVTLGKLMGSKRETLLWELTEAVLQINPAMQNESEVAYSFNQNHQNSELGHT